MVIAVADNIADSLGIHVYQESQLLNYKVIRVSTFFNFFTRFLVMLIFMLLVAFFQIHYAVILSIVYGITLLSVMSYLIAREQKVNPYRAILQHVTITAVVVLISNFLGEWIMELFSKT